MLNDLNVVTQGLHQRRPTDSISYRLLRSSWDALEAFLGALGPSRDDAQARSLIREVGEHTEEQKAGETVVPQEGEEG